MRVLRALALCAFGLLGALQVNAMPGAPATAEKISLTPSYFESNRGQVEAQYPFLARLGNYTVLAGPGTITLLLPQRSASGANLGRKARLALRFGGATVNRQAKIRGEGVQLGRVNYYLGGRKHWTTGVSTYSSIRYERLYPGIDLVLRLTEGRLEYDLELEPWADPKAVRIETQGSTSTRLDAKGNLRLSIAGGQLTQFQPVIYQTVNGRRTPIPGRFNLLAKDSLAFEVGEYRRDQRLIIDPVIGFSTYLGGDRSDPSNSRDRVDTIQSVTRDSDGNAIVVGQTTSVGFPLGSAVVPDPINVGGFIAIPSAQANHGGTFCLAPDPNAAPKRPDFDGFIAKFSPTGSLIFSTYLGGCGSDAARAVVLDASNDIYLVGSTTSPDFPTSTAAAQSQTGGKLDGFAAKFSRNGELKYSTYVGGSDDDGMRALQVDPNGGVWATGYTKSVDFPIGRAPDCAADLPAVQCNFGGGVKSDAFLVRIATNGQDLTYTTFLGGSGDDVGESLALRQEFGNANGLEIMVAGETESGDFPLGKSTPPYKRYHPGTGECRDTDGDLVGPSHLCRDAFAVLLTFNLSPNNYAARLRFGTLLGGAKDEEAIGIAFSGTPTGALAPVEFWLAGNTRSVGAVMTTGEPIIPDTAEKKSFLDFFPLYKRLTEDSIAPEGGLEPFLAKISATLDLTNSRGEYDFALQYSTFLGGTDSDAVAEMKVVHKGDKIYPQGGEVQTEAVYLGGRTASRDFPTKNAFQAAAVNEDGFVAKIREADDKAKLELVYSTLLGAEQADYVLGLTSNSVNTIVAGGTTSNQFPVAQSAYQNRHGAVEDAFIVSLIDDDQDVNSIAKTDIALTVEASVGSVILGKDIRLTLTAINNGATPAEEPRLVMEIPAGVEIISNSMAAFCTLAKRDLYCNVGDAGTPAALRNGKNVPIVLVIRPKFTGEVILQASVLSRTADINTLNNKATRRVSVVDAPNRGDFGLGGLLFLLGWGALCWRGREALTRY